MPWSSEKQRKFLWANKPGVAKKFAEHLEHGGGIPQDPRRPKKITKKDRYGNSTTVEFAEETKPLDLNSLIQSMMDKGVPQMQGPIDGDITYGNAGAHPGGPQGPDTVPAWLTPGEFVVNAEAMSVPENAAMVEQINNHGRAMQMNEGGGIPVPISPTQALLESREGYRGEVYLDSLNKPTVGHGHLLPEEYKDQVGETPFSKEQLDAFFDEDREIAREGAKRNAKKYGVDWDSLSRREKVALTSMAFQLGETGQGKFENMWTKLAAGDKEGAALEALDSNWASQTPQRAKDVYSAFQPGLGFNYGGPVYAYRGYDVAEQDAYDIEDPNTDLSGDWVPPVYEADEISPMEQAILDQEAMAVPPEDTGEAPEEMGDFWSGIADWAMDTSVADARNADFNVKVAEANNESARETLTELETRVQNGQPVNSQTLESAKAAVDHTQNEVTKAVAEDAAINANLDEEDFETEVIANNEPGDDDDKHVLKELAESPEFEEEDDPSKPSEKGQQPTPEVIAEGEAAAKQNPEMLEKAKGFFKGAFSDLFDGKELARMAIMYVGSRALGYSHGGSLNWAAKQYVSRLDAKDQSINNLIKSGKYTPASIKQYKETGDISVLQTPGVPANPLGNFKTFYKDGKKVRAQEYKVGDAKVWRTADGRNVDSTYNEDASMVRGTPEYGKRIKEDSKQYTGMIQDLRAQFGTTPGGRDQQDTYGTELAPTVAGNKVAKWALNNNVPPEYMGSIVENAYHAALEHGKATGEKVRDLTPFLEEQYVAAQVGDTSLFKNKDGRTIDGVSVNKMFSAVKAAAGDVNLSTTQILQGYQKAWDGLDPETQEQWNRKATDHENGFMKFVMNDVNKNL